MNLIPGKLYETLNDINIGRPVMHFGPSGFQKYIKKGSICMLTTAAAEIAQPDKIGLFTIIKFELLYNNEIHVVKVFNKNLKFYLKEI